jgi:hypothetical protein
MEEDEMEIKVEIRESLVVGEGINVECLKSQRNEGTNNRHPT